MTLILTLLALLTFVMMLVVSGYPILRLWIDRQLDLNFFGVTSISFSLGLAVWTWLTWVGFLIEINLFLLVGLFALISILLYVFLYLRKLQLVIPDHFKLDSYAVGLIASTSAIMIVYYFVGSFQDPSADSFGHLAFIRKVYETSVVSSDIFIASSQVPYNLGNAAYAYTTIYPLFAFLAEVFGIDPAVIWFHMPGVMLFIFISAFLFLAFSVLKEHKYVLVFALLLLLTWAVWGHGFRGVGYPNTLSFIMYLVVMGLMLAIPNRDHWGLRNSAGVVFLASSMVLVHSQWWAFLFGSIGLMMLFQLVVRRFRPAFSTALILGGIALFSVPLLLTKTSFYQIISSELENILQYRYTDQLFFIGDLYAFNLLEILSSQHFIWILFSIILLAVLLIRRIELNVIFEVAFSAFIVLMCAFIMINPVTVSIISELATTTVAARLRNLIREWGLFPVAYLIGSFWPQLVHLSQRLDDRVRKGLVLISASALVAYLIFEPALRFLRGLSGSSMRQQIIDFLMHQFGLRQSTLHWLYDNITLILVCAALLFLAAFAVLLLVLRPWRWIKADVSRLRTGKAAAIYIPLAITLFLLIVPSSQLSPWGYLRADSTYARLYGPTLSQVDASPQFDEFFETFEQGSVIITDNRKFMLAFRDILVSGDVQGETEFAKEVNASISPIFDLETENEYVLEKLASFDPDYLVLSPRYSHLAWMKYDNYSALLEKIYDEVIPGINYFNNRFVIYEVHSESAESLLASFENEVPNVQDQPRPANCSISRIEPPYSLEIEPQGWNVTGDDLYDGVSNTTEGSLLWIPPRSTWFYVQFDLEGEHFIDRVEVLNHHFSNSYQLNGLALFVSEDGIQFSEVERLTFPERLGAGDHSWSFDVAHNANFIRLAIHSQSSTTLGEVEIYGCPTGDVMAHE